MDSADWKDITIEFRGKQVKGRYDVVGKEITVISWNGIKKAQLVGTFSAEKVAHMLLRELASEADRRSRTVQHVEFADQISEDDCVVAGHLSPFMLGLCSDVARLSNEMRSITKTRPPAEINQLFIAS
jgi:hypothetical protein